MTRKDVFYFAGMFIVAALLLANILRPTAPYAYDVAEPNVSVPVGISAVGDSAWAIIGTRVYYVSLRERSQLPSGQRSINQIDSRDLN